MLLAADEIVRGLVDFHLGPFFAPEEAAAEHVGMQRANEYGDPRQRYSRPQHAAAELGQDFLRRAGSRRALVQPVNDRLDVQFLRSHRLDSRAPGTRGSRLSTPDRLFAARWLENSTAY